MTNFLPTCVGYVKKSKQLDKAVGFLIQMAQKESKEENETDEEGNGECGSFSISLNVK